MAIYVKNESKTVRIWHTNIIKIPPAPLWKGENMKNAANMNIITSMKAA